MPNRLYRILEWPKFWLAVVPATIVIVGGFALAACIAAPFGTNLYARKGASA